LLLLVLAPLIPITQTHPLLLLLVLLTVLVAVVDLSVW
jgi:hypothetical protein